MCWVCLGGFVLESNSSNYYVLLTQLSCFYLLNEESKSNITILVDITIYNTFVFKLLLE